MTVSANLAAQFQRRWEQNNASKMRARLARWRVMHWLVLQRLGFTVWAQAWLFFHCPMQVLTGETVSGGLLAFGYAENALTNLLLKTLTPGMTFVDIGAHFGYEAMLASALVGREGHVISFEPQPKVAAVAKKNLRRFPQARVEVAAVGESEGTLELEARELKDSAFTGRAGQGQKMTVPMVTLAGALKPSERAVDVIKCDAEGSEIFILQGSLDLIREDQPFLILEAEMPDADPKRTRVMEMEALLKPLGYRTLIFDFDGELRVGNFGDFTPSHANIAFYPPSWQQRIASLLLRPSRKL